ncbi:MAG: lipoprotein [Bacilli bacterium]|nr:lipoprotein [Bacilli bacterium]
MKKKLLLILVFVLVLTGCSNEYNLTINGDTISEEIISTIPNNEITTQTAEEKAAGIENDDQITPFINNDQYPFTNNNKIKYKKDVSKNGLNTIVKLNYDYTVDNFKNSRVYNECFQKSVIERKDGYLRLAFLGEFSCLYGDSLTINVRTDRKVIDDTANDVDNNTYTWIINDNNENNVNIQMILDDNTSTSGGDNITLFFIILLIIFIGVDIYIIFKKKKR